MIEPVCIYTRWSAPSKYDECPYGTIIRQSSTRNNECLQPPFEVYVQMSKDDRSPLWEKIGTFTSDDKEVLIQHARKLLNLKQIR